MALKKYFNLGKNGLSGSGFTQDSYYTTYGGVSLGAGNKIESILSVIGENYYSTITNLNVGDRFDLIRLDSNNKLIMEIATIRKNATTSFGTQDIYTLRTLLVYNENEVAIGSCVYESKNIVGGVTYTNPCYFCVATDGTSNSYFVFASDAIIEYGGNIPFLDRVGGFTQNLLTGMTEQQKPIVFDIITNSSRGFDSDPWKGAGYSEKGGGEGSFDFSSDTVSLPSIPSVDAVSTGFLQLFSSNLPKIRELASYMWSTDFFDSVVKITANPIDIIMGLYMYPFSVPASQQKYVRAGNVITNIVMNVPDSQIIEIDCGTYQVTPIYDTYLDYEPFTKCEIYLPYCGTFPLSMDDINGNVLNVRYRIDLLTGVCCAYILINDSVKYNFTGSCAINIPISSRSFENIYNSIVGIAGSMFGGSSFSSPSVGSISGVVTSGKNQIQRGGVASSNAGFLGCQKPYLIFTVPRVAIPIEQNTFIGYPIFGTYKLGDLQGYTEIESIHLENIEGATETEKEKIVSLLKEGVIL